MTRPIDTRPPTDPERFTASLAAVGVFCVSVSFLASGWLALVGLALLGIACRSSGGQWYLFGPFLSQELRLMTRRYRTHLWRSLIALVVGVPLAVFYFIIYETNVPLKTDVSSIATVGYLFIGSMLFLIVFSTMTTFISYAVAEDRESKRLDFQLVTDLRNRELVVGKVFARVIGLLAYPAAGVPLVLSLPLLFNVEPAVILYSFAYAAVTTVSIIGLCALGSVLASNKNRGGNLFGLVMVPYVLMTFAIGRLQLWPGIWFFPGTPTNPVAVSVETIHDWMAVGNPLAMLVKWARVGVQGSLTVVADDFPAYASFHVGLGLGTLLYAARIVRRVSAGLGGSDSSDPHTSTKSGVPDDPIRPAVSDRPVAWREAYCNHLMAKARGQKTLNRLFGILFIVLPVTVMLLTFVSDMGGYRETIIELAKYMPMLAAWLGGAAAGRFGLESICREREKDTLISLVLTPLSPREIVVQKFWGLMWLQRSTFTWVLLVGVSAIVIGSIPWWCFVGLILYMIVFMMEMLSVGLMFSAKAPSVEKASRAFGIRIAAYTMTTVTALSLAFAAAGGPTSPLRFYIVGVFPPVALLASGHGDWAKAGELAYYIYGFLGGMLLNAGLAWLFWCRAVRNFEAACDPASETGPQLDNRGKQ